ncbi:hypothetical protein [Sphingomonas quercus]|uniref:Uncharacterized protein n=1 Tax=Sphingomonas quercus TaxID=2842451 RepID=A0ABS6BG88_9SPHN|nr:hypothetical protein [Sphingomonas quercus]MBU3077308.1 hypothetical protein [Sphingomonas quercus]
MAIPIGLRSILLLESIGPEAIIDGLPADGTADVAEIRAVALLRSNRAGQASAELRAFLESGETAHGRQKPFQKWARKWAGNADFLKFDGK